MKEKGEIRAEMRQRRKAVTTDDRVAASLKICERLTDYILGEIGKNGETGENSHLPTLSPSHRFTVAVYLASPDEIDLTPFIEHCLSHPLTLSPSHPLRLVAPRWNGADYELAALNGCWPDKVVQGPHGILEPPKDAPGVEASEVGVWIVPGLAFTKDGARLGYGGGWYDRLMARSQVEGPIERSEIAEGLRQDEGQRSKVKGQTSEGKLPLSDLSPLTSDLSLSPLRLGVGYRFQVVDALPTEPHDVMLDEIVTD